MSFCCHNKRLLPLRAVLWRFNLVNVPFLRAPWGLSGMFCTLVLFVFQACTPAPARHTMVPHLSCFLLDLTCPPGSPAWTATLAAPTISPRWLASRTPGKGEYLSHRASRLLPIALTFHEGWMRSMEMMSEWIKVVITVTDITIDIVTQSVSIPVSKQCKKGCSDQILSPLRKRQSHNAFQYALWAIHPRCLTSKKNVDYTLI